ncbi:Hypothetical predicted protein [Pelobates cultripes]|uniref:Uncharacterized protein n=1 Tax=Pelobates cultripes TaxID=61616 RepID=A0AAD1WW43_PELCU|nr:Hypothetical predicted protein [Pelobates cultripes]
MAGWQESCIGSTPYADISGRDGRKGDSHLHLLGLKHSLQAEVRFGVPFLGGESRGPERQPVVHAPERYSFARIPALPCIRAYHESLKLPRRLLKRQAQP